MRFIFLRKNSDALLAIFVIAVFLLLVVPLPTVLVDLLLAVNISFALLLLLIGLYLSNALALLAFPSILLLTTLFRLGLNIATTRLILSEAEAGRVISAFGTFLIGEELAVGVIIFIIITIVNFVVIARGAGRVSEVAARFALDALPGKQMAIDSDMRAGIISADEAQRKREDLRKESQLFGSMDGAMNFVKGDAIAGVFITFTNILGGMYLGLKNGMSAGEAVDTYTMLTIGDGLVTQIPALLISICAGIVVTRVSSAEGVTLGSDIGKQLFQKPGLLFTAGVIVFIISLLPDIPAAPFIVVAFSFMAISVMIARKNKSEAVEQSSGIFEGETRLLTDSTGATLALPMTERVVIFLDQDVLFKSMQADGDYRKSWDQLRLDCYKGKGIELPDIILKPDNRLASGAYRVEWNGIDLVAGTVLLDSLLAEINPSQAEVLGLRVLEAVAHPLYGSTVCWVSDEAGNSKIMQSAGISSFYFQQFIFLQIVEFMVSHPEEIVSITGVHEKLKEIEKKYPGLMADSFSDGFINAARVTSVLQEMLRQGLSIGNVRQVIELMASYCTSYGSSLVQQGEFDVHDIVSYIRQVKKRQAISGGLSHRGTLKVINLSPALQEVLEEAGWEMNGSNLAVEPGIFDSIRNSIYAIVDPIADRGLMPVSILCRSDLSQKVQALLVSCGLKIGLIVFEELEPSVNVERVANWNC